MKLNLGKFAPVLATMLFGTTAALSQRATAEVQITPTDTNLQAEVMNHALKGRTKRCDATAHDGVVVLRGTVNVFALKEEANKRVHKIKGVQAVWNDIEIAGTNVPDPVLQQKLAKAIS
jgi:hyperosmotically inducible periplasmic protein